MRWEVKVTNVDTRLRVRTGPSTSYRIVNWQYPSGGGIVVESRKSGSSTWYRWEGTSYWSCGISSKGTVYLKKVKDLEEKKEEPKEEPKVPTTTPVTTPTTTPESQIDYKDVVINDVVIDHNGFKMGGSTIHDVQYQSTWYQPSYKGSTSFKEIDYATYSNEFIAKEIAKIKYNMDIGYKSKDDIYSDYTQDNISKGYFSDLQKKMYNSFNRNKVAFPDKELTKTFAYVFFTRPDLNILKRGSSTSFALTDQVQYDKKYYYLWKNNQWCLKSLVDSGSPYHKFMVFLSNEAKSFEVGDVVLKTHEHGETYNGHKIIYGRSDIESNVAGEMSIRYIDTVNLDVFKLHLAWVDYINKVSRGVFSPKREYIKGKIIDYACSCYYILCGPDGNTILYWQKLTGVFPVNTSENAFSWDTGTLLAKPEINIKYMYSFKNTMDPYILHEFNTLTSKNRTGKKTYEEDNLHTGSTLTHAPYIAPSTDTEGNMVYRLVWLEN